MHHFYEETFQYTREVDGQYPRPWMTDLSDPLEANCFIVGRNQRNGYEVAAIGSQQRHVDALFNRNGASCRDLYDSLFAPSPTRKNIDRLSQRLKKGGARVIETNVICFSSPMSNDLTRGQRAQGSLVFKWLLNRIAPTVIIVHGRGAAKELSKLDTSVAAVIEMPSLAPPAYNKWHAKSDDKLDQIAAKALSTLNAKRAL